MSPGHPISGPLDYRHMYIDISNMEVDESEVTHAGHTCLGAMGYSFAAGTTDGECVSNQIRHGNAGVSAAACKQGA